MAIVGAQIFGAPPNLFPPTKLGYIFVFPFVFAVLGFILGAVLSDGFPKWAARHNHGVFESEFRLILLPPFSLSAFRDSSASATTPLLRMSTGPLPARCKGSFRSPVF